MNYRMKYYLVTPADIGKSFGQNFYFISIYDNVMPGYSRLKTQYVVIAREHHLEEELELEKEVLRLMYSNIEIIKKEKYAQV